MSFGKSKFIRVFSPKSPPASAEVPTPTANSQLFTLFDIAGNENYTFHGSTSKEKLEEGREYLRICGHNLHSVLNNPRQQGKWGDSIYDALTPSTETDTPILPFPGLEVVESADIRASLAKLGPPMQEFIEAHKNSMNDQLQSNNEVSQSSLNDDIEKCIAFVPPMFFKRDYEITDPATFKTITTSEMQDKLSGYLDRVELSLLRQISSRSNHFFAASSNQEDLGRRITEGCGQVRDLRILLSRLHNILAEKCLRVDFIYRRQKRANDLLEKLELIEEVKQTVPAVQALLQNNDIPRALDVINRAKSIMESSLKGIHALNSLKCKLDEYSSLISWQMTDSFVALVVSAEWDFDESISLELGNTKTKSEMFVELEMRMQPYLEALLRMGTMSSVLKQYSIRLAEEIKVVVKTVVAETIETVEQSRDNPEKESDSTVAAQLRALKSDDLCSCLKMIFEHLLLLLRRAIVVHDILCRSLNKDKVPEIAENAVTPRDADKLCEGVDNNSSSSSTTTTTTTTTFSLDSKKATTSSSDIFKGTVADESREVTLKACEFSQRSVSNIFSIRKDVQYSLLELRKLYDITMSFVVSIETITQKTDYSLRGALFAQVKSFLDKYHRKLLPMLVSTLDSEQWKMIDVTQKQQQGLEDLVGGKYSAMIFRETFETPPYQKGELMCVTLHGHTYRVVGSVLYAMEIVQSYIAFANNFPAVSSDVLQKIVEILRLFNSRTAQLVLGAGAMQVAKLKSISARHLALASQALELVMEALPHIKQSLSLHLSQKQHSLLAELDRVLQDFIEHNEKIFSKFVAMVEEIMKKSLEGGRLESIDYDSQKNDFPSTCVKEIVENSTKLHTVLRPVISPERLQEIYTRIFTLFALKLPGYFEATHPTTSVGKQRVIGEIQYLVGGLRKLNGLVLTDEKLELQFQEKYGR